jgi:hypothetical protein
MLFFGADIWQLEGVKKRNVDKMLAVLQRMEAQELEDIPDI